jgi:mono/diheme cytochrome c family protein
MHLQSIWPFADRFTLDTVHEDPGFRTEALGGALALGGAMVLLGVAVLLRRRWSWLIAACAVAIAGLAVPHLDLLFVPAYPTSYYHCPTGFAASSILAGADLYPGHCAVCHGAEGRGDGPAANTLPVPAADLTAAHLWMHSDGELFWWLSQGITAPDGRQAMPGFAAALSEDQRWALIDFIRARNAGAALAATGHWPAQVQAPGLQARCAGNAVVSLADLRGGFLRLVDGAAGAVAGVTTIVFGVPSGTQPGPGLCVADDQGLPRAYGIVVDGAGWLRAVQRASMQPGWTDAAALAREIAQLKANPVHQAEPGGMTMDMKMDMKM